MCCRVMFTSSRILKLRLQGVRIGSCEFHTTKRFSATENFERGLNVNVNLITLGDSGHGKTLLNSQLSKLFSKNVKLPEDFDRGSSHSGSHRCTHFEWANEGQLRFSHSDVPGLPNYFKSLGTHLFQMHGAVLVFDASKGISLTGKNHYHLFKHATSKNKHGLVIPLVNLTSTDDQENEELKQLALEEMAEFLSPEELSNVVIGSVRSDATIRILVERLTNLLDLNALQSESSQLSKLPIYWPLENVGDIPNRGMFWAGRLQTGILSKGQKVTLRQGFQTFPAFVREIEIFQKQTPDLYPGDRGGAFVRLKAEIEVKRGAFVLGEKGQLPHEDCSCSSQWEVQLKPLPTITTPLKLRKENGLFHMTLNDTMVHISEEHEIKPGEEFHTSLSARNVILARPGEPFILCKDKTTFLYGNFLQPKTT